MLHFILKGFMLVALFRFLSLFPLPVLHGLGSGMAWMVYFISPTWRRRLQKNISQAGYKEHTCRAVSEAGKSMFELPFIWCAPPDKVLKKAKIENWEIVQDALDAGRGVVLLTPHLGCFEIIAQVIAAKTPLTALYRPPRKKALQPLIEGARSRPGLLLAPANLGGVRSMLKALKKGAAVGLLPDQVPQKGEGVWADFFGRPAYTMTLSFKLHSMTGAPVILSYAERLSAGRGYIIRFVPFSAGSPDDGSLNNSSLNNSSLNTTSLDGTAAQQARVINIAMENLIKRCPAQYFWSYNRYKKPAHAAAAEMSKT